MFIWWCAEQVYPGRKCDQYAVLGDDVVIADQYVADVYARSLARLGVKISYSKSLISSTGAVEFAKRVKGLSRDLSPRETRNLLNSHHPFGLMAVHITYPLKRLTTLARVGGAGFRQLARFDHRRNRHFERVVAMWNKGRYPLELWLGRGRPINPYLRGIIIDHLCKEMRPRELNLIPDDLFER